MTKEDLLNDWQQSISAGTFLTPKHHPSGVGQPDDQYRSVTVHDPSGIKQFLDNGQYRLLEYSNSAYPNTPQYIVVEPNDPTTVAGSGIPPLATVPTTALDRFVVVSGSQAAWHIYAESQSTIAQKEAAGSLMLQGEIL